MKRYFKVYKDFNNFISIDDTEIEKALRAFKAQTGAIFEGGATARIEAILPDNVRMMGWNEGYKPLPEEMGEISRDGRCMSAQRLIGQIKEHLALNPNEPFKELGSGVKKHTDGLTSLGDLLTN